MQILAWVLFGLLAGALARLLVPGRDPLGWLGTIMLGIVGSFVGGFLGSVFYEGEADLEPSSLIGSVIGAVLALLAWRALKGRRVLH